jgi:hypothetical protein
MTFRPVVQCLNQYVTKFYITAATQRRGFAIDIALLSTGLQCPTHIRYDSTVQLHRQSKQEASTLRTTVTPPISQEYIPYFRAMFNIEALE